jgi:hypothetical protein
MDHEVPVAYIIVPIIVILPVFFLGLLGLISFILSSGGWRQLAWQYAARPGTAGNTTYRVVGLVGTSSYKGAIKVTTTGAGIEIEASPALYVGHKPLFLPYGVLRNPEKKLMFHGRDYLVFAVDDQKPVRLALPAAIFKGTPLEEK